MFFRFGVLLSVAMFSSAVFAHVDFVDCNAVLRETAITWTKQPFYGIEVESGGKIYGPDEKIPPLKTGFYIFLVLSTGEKLIAPKYDVQSYTKTKKGLATHKSLLELYLRKTGKSAVPLVVAPGEFQNAFWKVVDISNRSGNFKNTPERFDQMLPYLITQGLAIFDWTSKRAIDPNNPEDRGHTPADRTFDEFHLDMLEAVEQAKYGSRLRDLYEKFHALVLESFPGVPDKQADEKMLVTVIQGKKKTKDWRGYDNFLYPLTYAYKRDGIEFGILKLLNINIYKVDAPLSGTPFYEGLPAQINNLLVGAGSTFSEELRGKWQTLAKEFAQH